MSIVDVLASRLSLGSALEELQSRTPDAIGGENRDFLRVHRRDLKVTESGHQVLTADVAGKKTYYTDEQKLFDKPQGLFD